MTTSAYVAAIPSINTARRNCGRVFRAENFRVTLRQWHDRAMKALPLNGSERAIRAKVAGACGISIDESAAILAHASPEEAVDLLRALATDAEKHERIDIALSVTPTMKRSDLPAAERDFAVTVSRFLVAADDIATTRRYRGSESRRLRELEIGLEARARLLTVSLEDRDGA